MLTPLATPRTAIRSGGGSEPLHDESPVQPIALAVLADDPLTGLGISAYLRGRPQLDVLEPEQLQEAEVVLVVLEQVTDDTLVLIEQMAQELDAEDARFVLVGEGVSEHHIVQAAACGLVSLIPRSEANFERIVSAIVDIRDGRIVMPSTVVGWVVKHVRAVRQDVLEPNGLTASGLETREVDVLKLLADGFNTQEIADRLMYSERTVKNIIHGLLVRLKLRNRTQAVAYAIRNRAL